MNSAVDLIIIGGKVRLNEQSVIAYDYLFNFSELNILKAFICASGITIEKGISDYNLEEAHTRKKIIELLKKSMSPLTTPNSVKMSQWELLHLIKLITLLQTQT